MLLQTVVLCLLTLPKITNGFTTSTSGNNIASSSSDRMSQLILFNDLSTNNDNRNSTDGHKKSMSVVDNDDDNDQQTSSTRISSSSTFTSSFEEEEEEIEVEGFLSELDDKRNDYIEYLKTSKAPKDSGEEVEEHYRIISTEEEGIEDEPIETMGHKKRETDEGNYGEEDSDDDYLVEASRITKLETIINRYETEIRNYEAEEKKYEKTQQELLNYKLKISDLETELKLSKGLALERSTDKEAIEKYKIDLKKANNKVEFLESELLKQIKQQKAESDSFSSDIENTDDDDNGMMVKKKQEEIDALRELLEEKDVLYQEGKKYVSHLEMKQKMLSSKIMEFEKLWTTINEEREKEMEEFMENNNMITSKLKLVIREKNELVNELRKQINDLQQQQKNEDVTVSATTVSKEEISAQRKQQEVTNNMKENIDTLEQKLLDADTEILELKNLLSIAKEKENYISNKYDDTLEQLNNDYTMYDNKINYLKSELEASTKQFELASKDQKDSTEKMKQYKEQNEKNLASLKESQKTIIDLQHEAKYTANKWGKKENKLYSEIRQYQRDIKSLKNDLRKLQKRYDSILELSSVSSKSKQVSTAIKIRQTQKQQNSPSFSIPWFNNDDDKEKAEQKKKQQSSPSFSIPNWFDKKDEDEPKQQQNSPSFSIPSWFDKNDDGLLKKNRYEQKKQKEENQDSPSFSVPSWFDNNGDDMIKKNKGKTKQKKDISKPNSPSFRVPSWFGDNDEAEKEKSKDKQNSPSFSVPSWFGDSTNDKIGHKNANKQSSDQKQKEQKQKDKTLPWFATKNDENTGNKEVFDPSSKKKNTENKQKLSSQKSSSSSSSTSWKFPKFVQKKLDIPRVDKWTINKKGEVKGIVTNHKEMDDGTLIITSKLANPNLALETVIVTTASGSKYLLGDPKYTTHTESGGSSTTADNKGVVKQEKEIKRGKQAPLTGESIGNEKYLLAGKPKKSVNNRCMIWSGYRNNKNGSINVNDKELLAIKISDNKEAMDREFENYKKLDSGIKRGVIIEPYEYFEFTEKLGQKSGSYAIVMERGMEDLRTFQHHNKISGITLRNALWSIAKCIEVIHSNKMVWTDLKTENFVVVDTAAKKAAMASSNKKKMNDDYSLLSFKAIDLESAVSYRGNPIDYTPESSPPEFAKSFFNGDAHEFIVNYNYDIWSFGMIAYDLAVGRGLFDKLTPIQIMKRLVDLEPINRDDLIRRLRRSQIVSEKSELDNERTIEQIADLILPCLSLDPKQRPGINKILSNPYFRGASSSSNVKSSFFEW